MQAFPVYALLASLLAYWQSAWFATLSGGIFYALAMIMFAMGLTLTSDDFARVLKRPKPILLGVALQFLLMPALAFGLTQILDMPLMLAVGFILLGVAPGGTASNVMCFLAKADVALSISMTAMSSLLAVVLTPWLMSLWVDQSIQIDVWAMLANIAHSVLMPVLLGVWINQRAPQWVDRVRDYLPSVAMWLIIFIVAVVVALNHDRLASVGWIVLLAVALHNALGLLLGYWAARGVGMEERACRTIAIEVGMQNSGLAVALAMKFFLPLAMLPGALFSIWHNITGSLLASYWSRR